MIKCTRSGETLCVLGEIYLIFMLLIVCEWLVLIITPSPMQGVSIVSIRWEGVQRQRMRKAPVVQTGRALVV